MNFGDTFLSIGSFRFYEPLVLLTNTLLFLLSIKYFIRLKKFDSSYSKLNGTFILMLGISSLMGGIAHAVHEQWGDYALKIIVSLCHFFSLISAYYCLMGSYQIYTNLYNREYSLLGKIAILWLTLVLIIVGYTNQFVIITIHAGLVLAFAFYMHYKGMRNQIPGVKWVTFGIAISFISVIVHIGKVSIHEWFNYKDLAHTFMIVSLILIGKGFTITASEGLQEDSEAAVFS